MAYNMHLKKIWAHLSVIECKRRSTSFYEHPKTRSRYSIRCQSNIQRSSPLETTIYYREQTSTSALYARPLKSCVWRRIHKPLRRDWLALTSTKWNLFGRNMHLRKAKKRMHPWKSYRKLSETRLHSHNACTQSGDSVAAQRK
jgi:hypothetical protein